MYDSLAALLRQGKAAALEDLEHRRVVRQHFGDELFEPRAARDLRQMAQERRPNTPALVRILHGESDLGAPGLRDDVARCSHQPRLSRLLDQCRQRDMALEIDLRVEGHLLLAEGALRGEKSPRQRLAARAAGGGRETGAVCGLEGADLELAAVAQRLERRIFARIHPLARLRGYYTVRYWPLVQPRA